MRMMVDNDVTCSITKTHWDRSGGMFWKPKSQLDDNDGDDNDDEW